MDKYVYKYEDNLYINLTNKCCNNCEFCIRRNGDGIGDSGNLWLKEEPSSDRVIALIEKFDPNEYKDIVFCGYGESTYRLLTMVKVAEYCHKINKRTRLNTNGLGSLINGKDIVPFLKGAIDIVSVSLNESTPQLYQNLCHSIYGEKAFDELLDFTKRCVDAGIETKMTIVDFGQIDVAKCQELANKVGSTLRVRTYIK